MPEEVKIRHLRYFLQAVQAGSLRKAAHALELRESTISRAVKDLEDQVGAILLFRHSSGVELTPAGYDFWNSAHDILQRLDASIASTRSIAKTSGLINDANIPPTLSAVKMTLTVEIAIG